jgi:hypothetical protein
VFLLASVPRAFVQPVVAERRWSRNNRERGKEVTMRLNRIVPMVLVAGTLAVASCGGSGLPTGTGAGCGQPAGGTFQAGQNLGGYWGNTLPGTFAQLNSEAQVDAAITRESTGPNWTCFQACYGGAVRKWRENTGR